MAESSRIIVVTGSSRGLGRALVRRFAEAGHRVVGCSRSGSAPENLPGGPHRFSAVDVSEDAQVARWASEVLNTVGPPSLLVNNAAVTSRNGLLWQVPADEVELTIRVNVLGTINVLRHFVPAMVRRNEGVIANFSSYWGRSTAAEVAPYCASKWAVEGLTRALAQELPKTMAAVTVNPGVIDTDMLRSIFGEAAGRHLDPDTWSQAAAPFLLGLGPKDNGKPLTVPGQ